METKKTIDEIDRLLWEWVRNSTYSAYSREQKVKANLEDLLFKILVKI